MDSRVKITTEANAVEENKEYYVCASFKKKIVDVVDSKKKKSD